MSMKVNITNHLLSVGSMELVGVAAASMVQIGDTDTITLYSIFDTPPEAIIVGPFAPCRSRPPENRRREPIQSGGGETVLPIVPTSQSLQAEPKPGTPIPFGDNNFLDPNGPITIKL